MTLESGPFGVGFWPSLLFSIKKNRTRFVYFDFAWVELSPGCSPLVFSSIFLTHACFGFLIFFSSSSISWIIEKPNRRRGTVSSSKDFRYFTRMYKESFYVNCRRIHFLPFGERRMLLRSWTVL